MKVLFSKSKNIGNRLMGDEAANKEELLNQLMKRWQDQVANSLNDPDTISKTMEMMSIIQKSYVELLNKANHNDNYTPHSDSKNTTTNDSSDGTVAYDGLSYDQCLERIARLERRVEILESEFFRIKASTEA